MRAGRSGGDHSTLSDAEREYLRGGMVWSQEEGACANLQSTEPQSAIMEHGGVPGRLDVPTAVAVFPKDVVPGSREFAERWFDVRRWTEMPRGGHFAAWEEPGLLADDIGAFFGSLPMP